MPAYPNKGGGGGGSGGGLTLGPPTNSFTAATKAAAETARDTYATANPTWLTEYDAQPTYTIILAWPAVPTNTVYQARRSLAWADVTGLVRGPRGVAGAQGRFAVYAYIGTATAPTAAPTGGTFVRSTGTLTVPTGYTAAPATPGASEKTYRAEAVVNPATDTDTVTLTWSIPIELPAYAAAALAIAAQAGAETAQALAEQAAGTAADIPTGSPRGALIGTSPTLSTATTTNATVRAFGAAEVWTLGPNAPAGFTLALIANNERFLFPDLHSPGLNGVWYVVEVGGVEIDEVFMPWGGVSQSPANANSVQYLSAAASGTARNLTIRYFARSGDTPAYAAIYGAGTVLPANTVLKVYAAVVRGEKGDPGTGDGSAAGFTEAQIQAFIDATPLSQLAGSVTDAQIPAAIMRDAELTASAVRTLLGLTEDEVNDLFTGATIAGQVVTFTQNDGTTDTLTIPAGTAGMADGVVASGAFNATGTELVLTLDTGGTVTVNVPALLRAGAGDGTADVLIDELGTSAATITLTDNLFWVGTGVTIPATTHGILIDLSPATDDYHFVDWDTIRLKDAGVIGELSVTGQYETFVAQTVTGVGHLIRIGHDDAGQALLADDGGTGINIDFLRIERLLVPVNTVGTSFLYGSGVPADTLGADGDSYLDTDGGTIYKKASGAWALEYTFPTGSTPAPSHTSYVAISVDDMFTEAEFLAGMSGVGNALTVPDYTGTRYVAFARPTSVGEITEVYFYAEGAGQGNNQIGAWTVLTAALSISGEDHYIIRSNNSLNALSGVTFVVEVA